MPEVPPVQLRLLHTVAIGVAGEPTPRQAQRRRGQRSGCALLSQPAGELGEVEHLAEVDAVLEQAVLVQRQPRLLFRQRIGQGGLNQLDRVVVGEYAGEPCVSDPLQQLLVAPLQAGAGLVDQLRVGLLLHLEQHVGEAGVDAHHVAFSTDLVFQNFINSS
jgi:hypothetical protein